MIKKNLSLLPFLLLAPCLQAAFFVQPKVKHDHYTQQARSIEAEPPNHAPIYDQTLEIGNHAFYDIEDQATKQWFNAACQGKTEVLMNLFPKLSALGFKIDVRDEDGETALMLAAQSCNEATVKWLIHQGADVNVEDDGESPVLIWAARGGNLKIVTLIYNNLEDETIQEDRYIGIEIITLACLNDHVPMLAWAMKTYKIGAHESLDTCQNTPFTIACQSGSMKVLQYLVLGNKLQLARASTPLNLPLNIQPQTTLYVQMGYPLIFSSQQVPTTLSTPQNDHAFAERKEEEVHIPMIPPSKKPIQPTNITAFSSRSNLHPPQKTSPKKKWPCEICGKELSTKYTLKEHIRIHTGEKPYKCNYCEKAFIRKSNLVDHERVHKNAKPFHCTYCEKSYQQQHSLKEHIRTHTKEKPFKCNHCEKAFRKKWNLEVHQRIHTGEKPYQCSYCRKRFNQQSSLNHHIRIHTGEEPYRCAVCRKGFKVKSNYKQHLNTHTGQRYQCPQCPKEYASKNGLNAHRKKKKHY